MTKQTMRHTLTFKHTYVSEHDSHHLETSTGIMLKPKALDFQSIEESTKDIWSSMYGQLDWWVENVVDIQQNGKEYTLKMNIGFYKDEDE
jgi:hypothetical protein